MKGDPEQRALLLGEYIVAHGATVRAAARAREASISSGRSAVSTRTMTSLSSTLTMPADTAA